MVNGETGGCCRNAKLRHLNALFVHVGFSAFESVSPLLARSLVRSRAVLLSRRKEAAVYQHQGVTRISKHPLLCLDLNLQRKAPPT